MPIVLLVHFDGTNGSTTFTDVSPSAHTLTTHAPAVVTTTNPKFGTGSGDFSGSSAAGITCAPNDFNFGSGQFTVEAWAYFTISPTSVQNVLSQWGPTGFLCWAFCMSSGSLSFYYSTTGSDNPVVQAAYAPTLNTWIHLAADRDTSNVLRIYANGAVIASATVSAAFYSTTPSACVIGNDTIYSRAFPGHLDEVRITTGLAQYGGAFTPPTGPFTGVTAMATTAGQMTQTPSGNPQWRAANGAIVWGFQAPYPPQTNRPHTGYSYGTYRDWVMRMGFNRTQGIGGWHIKVPRDPGATWYVAVTDDSSDTAAGITNDANHPPAGVR